MMAAGLVLLPCAFLKNLHAVSSLSFWNGVVHTVINAVILGYCILHISTWGWAKVSLGIDILSFPIALGVIVFSYTSQIFLPTDFKKKNHFKTINPFDILTSDSSENIATTFHNTFQKFFEILFASDSIKIRRLCSFFSTTSQKIKV